MNEREIIEVTEFEIGPLCYDYYWDGIDDKIYNEYFNENGDSIKHHFSDDFEYIDENVIYYDLEKSYEDKETIIKRKSDGKYFKHAWCKGYYENYYSETIEEVFPKQITKTIYE